MNCRFGRFLICVLAILVAASSMLFAADSDYISYNLHRYALVIGNGKYEEGALLIMV